MSNLDGVDTPSAEEAESEEQEEKKETISIRVSLFFDGTCNNKVNVRAGTKGAPWLALPCEKGSYKNDISNVVKLEEAWQEKKKENFFNFPIYIEGAGTFDEGYDQIDGMALGKGAAGVDAKVKKGIKNLISEIERLNEDKEEIECVYLDAFGFSRGAATARYFIYKAMSESGKTVKDRLTKKGHTVSEVKVKFVGLFDTVASHGTDHEDDSKDLHLDAVKSAEYVLQLAAADEHRLNFRLTNINSVIGSKGYELFLPGVHSDIGGGYVANSPEKNLPVFEIFDWVDYLNVDQKNALLREKERLIESGWYFKKDVEIVYKRKYHGLVQVNRSSIQNEYSRIPLHIMADFAQDKGVNVAKKASKKNRVPEALRTVQEEIKSKILKPGSVGRTGPETWQDCSGITDDFKHKYLHFSAHYEGMGSPHKPQFADDDCMTGQRERIIQYDQPYGRKEKIVHYDDSIKGHRKKIEDV